MHTNFELPEGHNPVISKLITKKNVLITYTLAHQSAASTSTMGFAWLGAHPAATPRQASSEARGGCEATCGSENQNPQASEEETGAETN
jgi:hypothetical protein